MEVFTNPSIVNSTMLLFLHVIAKVCITIIGHVGVANSALNEY